MAFWLPANIASVILYPHPGGVSLELTRKEVLHIAKLARIGLNEEEIDVFSRRLSNILENFEVLNQVNTDGVTPTSQANPLYTVIKDDVVKPSLEANDVLANAPSKDGEFFKIRPVLEK